MKAIGEFDDEDANVRAGSNKKSQEVTFGLWEVGI